MNGIRQARERIVGLIRDGEVLNPSDPAAFRQWVELSYRALEAFPSSQQQFAEYCRSSGDNDVMRIFVGLHLLRLTAYQLTK
jgi:hypothetical protein